jgi:hypothetical protein
VFCFLQNEKPATIFFVILLFNVFANGALLPHKSTSSQEVHLVRCLAHISHRYFAPGKSLVISSPYEYLDVQQELIAEIHRTAIWPVVVTVDGKIGKSEKTDVIHRDGSYIVLIPDGNSSILHDGLWGLFQDGTKFTRPWNSDARFVVAGTYQFSMSKQTQIFEYLSKFRIYNCIIISQEHYTFSREYSRPMNGNEIDTGMKFDAYTWFPYQSPDRCTDVNDITQLDSWVISAQGHFTNNTDLFPRKISNSFNGCPMKAVVRESYSDFTTSGYYTRRNPKVLGYVTGLEVDLLLIVLKQINMTFEYVPTPEGFDIYQGLTYNLMVAMITKNAYIALGAVGTHNLEGSILESTNAHILVSASWNIPCPDKYPRWSSIFRIHSVELWLVLIISIVVAAISTTLVARYSCTSEWQGYKTLTSSLTNIWSVILGVSVSMMPRAPSVRLLFLAWVCFSTAFNTAFQAFLTTFLVDSGYKKAFQNLNDVSAAGISFYYKTEYSFLFVGDEKLVHYLARPHQQPVLFKEIMNWASHHKSISFFDDELCIAAFYAWGDFVGENCEPLICKLEDSLVYIKGLSRVIFHGDPLLRRVSEIIDRVVAAGLDFPENELI